ncbi:MAG: hypothetical protein ABI647_22150, partial [Gemmatimonadota bacterium]
MLIRSRPLHLAAQVLSLLAVTPQWTAAACLMLTCLRSAPAASQQLRVHQQFDVRMSMRDGVTLSADVWLPAAPGRYPTILMRT